MGTGVGTRTYSLVEQNSVAGLVEAKPEERRQFIEEAAGVSKYKSRKEAAVRKMEATKQNLLRLNDILREVKNQLNAVSRQAKASKKGAQCSGDLFFWLLFSLPPHGLRRDSLMPPIVRLPCTDFPMRITLLKRTGRSGAVPS